MREEIKTIQHILSLPDQCEWEVPIRHLIKSNYKCVILGDACLHGGRGFSDDFKFWCYLPWSEEIKSKTIKGSGKHSELVSINFLEFAVIIISYCAVLDAIELLGCKQDVLHQKVLILSDNTIADSWTRKIGFFLYHWKTTVWIIDKPSTRFR